MEKLIEFFKAAARCAASPPQLAQQRAPACVALRARRGAMAYPPERELRAAVRALAAMPLNNFSAAQVLARARQHLSGQRVTCALVQELPPPGAGGVDAVDFGVDSDGYIILSPRCSRRAWPCTPHGTPAPVRLHRWLGGVGAGLHGRHVCDNPSCIARAHIRSGTARENLRDQYERDRRTARPTTGERPGREPAATSPPRPLVRLSEAKESRETRFCVAGFDSPSKRARALRRAAATAVEPIHFGTE